MDQNSWKERIRKTAPKIHCMTNPVTMQDVANLLLAAGGSAIMAQDPAEVEEITSFCQATLLNLGVPDEEKYKAAVLAGIRANELGHPVILDPVGAGASYFRSQGTERLLAEVRPSVIRCNQEEACALLHMERGVSGGVESGVSLKGEEPRELAERLALTYQCTAFISGETDLISDGKRSLRLNGGDRRMARITGSGCMLSALCGLFCGTGMEAWEGACAAGAVWKECSRLAGQRTDRSGGGIGTFHRYLFDAVEELCYESKEERL